MKGQSKKHTFLNIASLIMLVVLVSGSWGTAQAVVIPTFNIESVQTDQTVTIKTYNFPANDTFDVLMNYIGTRGVGGIKVATVNSGSGGTFTATYNIPAELKGQRQIAIRLQSPTSAYFAYNWFYNNTSSPGTIPTTGGRIPTFDISSVSVDVSVTIKTNNFPANDTFRVLMGRIGTRGVGGIQVATVDSGAGGTFTATYNIPAELKGLRQIAIRLESSTSGYFAYNWFYNNTSGTIPDTGLPSGTIPTFSIQAVVKDTTVTIKTANFPANDTFDVLMNYIGTRGVGGTRVDTINSGTGGTLTMTFNIPDFLKGQGRIAIRLQSPNTGYFAYNWFYNSSTSGTIPPTGDDPVPTLPPGVIPTFSITSVSKDNTVTIKTANFPANDTFKVLMGAFGTKGVGGTEAGTLDTAAGGVLTPTFTIPAGLHGSDRIAIRLESSKSGYFSYNWFYNNTYP